MAVDQGEPNTCSGYGLSKALTKGFKDGLFGTKLDVSQRYVALALDNKDKVAGGRWPTSFDQDTISGS